jgi:predicted nucleic-acid-binding Zn-ribbon protein
VKDDLARSQGFDDATPQAAPAGLIYAGPVKTTETCPKCRSRKIIVVEEVTHKDPEMARTIRVPMVADEVANRDEGFFASANVIVEAGTFDVWICNECGYTEWYATKLGELRALAERSGKVRFIDREPGEGGPYRG